jgi:putative ABC transport system permease protein
MQGMRSVFRALVRRPGFTIVAIVTLALGIGANAAIFSVVDALLLRPLPYPDPDRIVLPWEVNPEVQRRTGFDRLPSSPADFSDYRRRNRTFAWLASMRADRVNLTGSGDPERVGAVRVSGEFFQVLGVNAVLGRTFLPEDGGGARVVMIGHALWIRRFAADPAVLEHPISLNGEPATVVGVLSSWFHFPAAGELPETLGFSSDPEIWTFDTLPPQQQRNRGGKSFALIGRLRDGVTLKDAQRDLADIAAAIAQEAPRFNAGWTVVVIPLREQLVAGIRPALMVLLTAVGFVLLIACANVANLLLVRAASRQREFCIRQALGAGRRWLLRQLLLESLLLALAAGAVGFGLAWWGLRGLLALVPSNLPEFETARLDWRVFSFTLGMSVATAFLFGLIPALQATRSGLVKGLREGGRGTSGSRKARGTRKILVIAEVALAVVMLIGAVLLTRTVVTLLRVDTGFDPRGVLTMEVALPRSAYPEPRAAAFFDDLARRLAAMPGVTSAGVTSSLPLTGAETLQQVTIEGHLRPEPGKEIIVDYRAVTAGYIETMRIPLQEGALLRDSVSEGESAVALINESMARTFWPGESPLGRRLKLTSYEQDAPWYTIVGVVGDTRQTALDSPMRPQVYVHQRRDPFHQMTVVMRTAGDPAALAAPARAVVLGMDPNQPIARIRPMVDVIAASAASRRFTMVLVGTFAALALVLSLIGLYAVLSHSVAERIQEMGVRLALGARPTDLLTLVLGEGLQLVAAGIVLGLGAAFIMTQSLQALLFGIPPRDLSTFVAVPVLLLVTAVGGCLVPARRAMRVDPIVALKTE